MTIYRITNVKGWHEIVETDPAGSISVIGCFRSDGEALAWLSVYVRKPTKRVFKVGWPEHVSQPMDTAKGRTAVLAA
jgi:hypothetical protein